MTAYTSYTFLVANPSTLQSSVYFLYLQFNHQTSHEASVTQSALSQYLLSFQLSPYLALHHWTPFVPLRLMEVSTLPYIMDVDSNHSRSCVRIRTCKPPWQWPCSDYAHSPLDANPLPWCIPIPLHNYITKLTPTCLAMFCSPPYSHRDFVLSVNGDFYWMLTINSNVSMILSMLMPVVSISNSATYPFSWTTRK